MTHTDHGPKHPPWFRLEPDGTHRQSGGLADDDYTLVFYRAKDGHTWPCPAVEQQLAGDSDHADTIAVNHRPHTC